MWCLSVATLRERRKIKMILVIKTWWKNKPRRPQVVYFMGIFWTRLEKKQKKKEIKYECLFYTEINKILCEAKCLLFCVCDLWRLLFPGRRAHAQLFPNFLSAFKCWEYKCREWQKKIIPPSQQLFVLLSVHTRSLTLGDRAYSYDEDGACS